MYRLPLQFIRFIMLYGRCHTLVKILVMLCGLINRQVRYGCTKKRKAIKVLSAALPLCPIKPSSTVHPKRGWELGQAAAF
jgi:hypothetical protein